MAFLPPAFNTTCNIWRFPAFAASYPPVVPAPLYANVPCQLRAPNPATGILHYLYDTFPLYCLCLPKLTDVQDGTGNLWTWPPPYDTIESPSGSSCFYYVVSVYDRAKGFTNEYREAFVVATRQHEGDAFYPSVWPPWPRPFP